MDLPARTSCGGRTSRLPREGGIARSLGVGIELDEEFGAPVRFVGLADRRRRASEALERGEEPAVLRVARTHVARPSPAGLPQLVEPPVVSDAEVRVRLDVVARDV